MEQQRRLGMRMLARGETQAAVARELKVAAETARRWAIKLARDGEAWQYARRGRRSRLDAAQKQSLRESLLKTAEQNGVAKRSWPWGQVAQLITRDFGVVYSRVQVWRLLGEIGLSRRTAGSGGRHRATRDADPRREQRSPVKQENRTKTIRQSR